MLVSDDKFGVSLCDITAGMNAVIGILQALLQRERTGCGSVVKVSLFDSAADLMAVPYLQARYGGSVPKRVGPPRWPKRARSSRRSSPPPATGPSLGRRAQHGAKESKGVR